MSKTNYKFMRILVFFDLPVTTQQDRRTYAQFRKFLLKQGFDMLQFSVYCRICNGDDAVEKHCKRINERMPPKGSVRVLTITDSQYARMKLVVGDRTQIEKKIGSKQLILL